MQDGDFDFLEILKILLNGKDIKDEMLNLYLDITKQTILNYCNISELPSSLNYLVCVICEECIEEVIINNSKGEVVGTVSSVSEDGRSVSFTNASEFKSSVENKISHINELNRYKRLYRL